VDSSIPNGDNYVLELVQGSDVNYSPQFSVSGGSQSASTSNPTTISTSTSTTSSSTQQHSSTTEPSSSTSSADSTSNSSPSQSSNPSTGSATSNPAVASSSPSSPAGLSTGDKAAIGVGVPFGVLLLGAAFFFGRLSRRSASPESTGTVAVTHAEKSELDGNEVAIRRSELPGSERDSGRRYELPESSV